MLDGKITDAVLKNSLIFVEILNYMWHGFFTKK
jgi:hypothetical protein